MATVAAVEAVATVTVVATVPVVVSMTVTVPAPHCLSWKLEGPLSEPQASGKGYG
jgi:hypothetical protein